MQGELAAYKTHSTTCSFNYSPPAGLETDSCISFSLFSSLHRDIQRSTYIGELSPATGQWCGPQGSGVQWCRATGQWCPVVWGHRPVVSSGAGPQASGVEQVVMGKRCQPLGLAPGITQECGVLHEHVWLPGMLHLVQAVMRGMWGGQDQRAAGNEHCTSNTALHQRQTPTQTQPTHQPHRTHH